ncbi:MAG: glutamate racemase [Rhodocyclaceae bacterium]|nr:glutamate racemase [Rhodocyclaceae bacterium]
MIGVFDSGLGGLSVLDALVAALPNADFIYFADSANSPYGNKSEAFIQSRVLAIGDYLADSGCTMIVVACNTATVAAIQALRSRHTSIAIVGVEPGIKPAALSSVSRKIAVLATEATAKSDRLAHLITAHAQAVSVDIVACPGWATLVEQCDLNDSSLTKDAAARLLPLLESGVDRIVLGCTHYSFLTHILQPIIDTSDNNATLVDVSEAIARQAVRLHQDNGRGGGSIRLLTTDQPKRLIDALPLLGLDLLATRVHSVERVAV